MARRIVITSGKGGVGKTTLTASLGLALAKMGLRVVLVDLDIGLNNLDVAMCVENKIVFDLIDVIEGRCRLKQALIQHDSVPNLSVLPSCHNKRKEVNGFNIKAVIDKLAENFDYILVDSPAGIDFGFTRAVATCDEAIIVATPHISSIRDAEKALTLISKYEMLSVYSVVNRIRGDLVLGGEMMDAYEVFCLLRANPLGLIPEDDNTNLGMLGFNSDVSEAFCILADNLHNGKNTMYDYTSAYKGFWGKIKRNMNRKAR